MQELDTVRPAYACFSRPRSAGGSELHSVYISFQDSLGFVWVGMQHGLARLDAHNVRHFTHAADDAHSLPGKFVIALGEDHKGNIWVGTYDGGCARFDPTTERFTPINLQPTDGNDRVVRCFQCMDDGRMWIGTNSSLKAIDPTTGRIWKFQHPPIDDPYISGINRVPVLRRLDDRRLLVGTASGAFIVDTTRESFQYLLFEDRSLLATTQHGIVSLAHSGDRIMAATSNQIYQLDRQWERLELFEPLVNPPTGAPNRNLTTLSISPYDERIWVGTMDGLLALDVEDGFYSHYQRDDTDPHSLCGSGIASMSFDRSGMLWIATANGISLLDLRHNFHYHRLRQPTETQRVMVRGFVEGDDGMIWIGTPNGLYEFDPTTRQSQRRSFGGNDQDTERINNQILQVQRGKRYLWIGSDNGLFQYDITEHRTVRQYHANPAAGTLGNMQYVMGRHVQGVLEDSVGYVWSGSDAMGVQRLDPDTGTFHYYNNHQPTYTTAPHDSLLTAFEDSLGHLWFGFVTCLARYDRATDSFETFVHNPHDRHSLSNNMVTVVFEDSRRRLWVGTASGLNRVVELDDGSLRFVRYGIHNGLPADFIISMLEHDSEFWLGTNQGVVRFRERDGRARLYDTSDGLHSNEYIHRAAFRDRQGRLYFGGRDGFDRFRPESIRPDTTPPTVVLTELRLFNRRVPIMPLAERTHNDKFALEQSITYLPELYLRYHHSVVTFGYAALHYLQPEKIQYAYMMEGFDHEWIEADGKTEATYTNLDPGNYTFRVRATNSDGVRCLRDAQLAIHIQPPPWRTWWAHSLYGLTATGTVALYTRWRIEQRERELREVQRIEQAREEERELIRRQNASDFHDEAGTTLTRILFLSELARRRGGNDKELQSLLEKIDDNATQLSQGMRDFIWVLDPDRDTLLDTLQRIETAGQSLLATAADTTFTMQYDHVRLRNVTLDLNQRRQVLMICKEALHNAARHANAQSVVVRADNADGTIIISVEDNGCGFESTGTSTGYGMKSMRTRATSINAQLTVISESGHGTRVELRIDNAT